MKPFKMPAHTLKARPYREHGIYRASPINDHLIAIIMAAYRNNGRVLSYRQLSEESGVPYRSMIRYIKDPRYRLVEFGELMGYYVHIRKNGLHGKRTTALLVTKLNSIDKGPIYATYGSYLDAKNEE